MTDFSQLSEEEVLAFVDTNFGLFATERDESFPANVIDQLPRRIHTILRREEGFAVAYNGRHAGNRSYPADLMFLYVRPEFEGQGIGSDLIAQIKAAVTTGVPIILTCEGVQRKRYFEGRGFTVVENDPEDDHYLMQWMPIGTHAA